MCKCKFYKVDEIQKKQFEEWEEGMKSSMTPEAWEAYLAECEEHNKGTDEDRPDPTADCGEFCMYLQSGKGYLGEDLALCTAPGNEHIMDCWFNEAAIK